MLSQPRSQRNEAKRLATQLELKSKEVFRRMEEARGMLKEAQHMSCTHTTISLLRAQWHAPALPVGCAVWGFGYEVAVRSPSCRMQDPVAITRTTLYVPDLRCALGVSPRVTPGVPWTLSKQE